MQSNRKQLLYLYYLVVNWKIHKITFCFGRCAKCCPSSRNLKWPQRYYNIIKIIINYILLCVLETYIWALCLGLKALKEIMIYLEHYICINQIWQSQLHEIIKIVIVPLVFYLFIYARDSKLGSIPTFVGFQT